MLDVLCLGEVFSVGWSELERPLRNNVSGLLQRPRNASAGNLVKPGPTEPGSVRGDFTNRSSTSWKWHSSCPALGYEGDGEAHFSDSGNRSEEHTSELQSLRHLVCR